MMLLEWLLVARFEGVGRMTVPETSRAKIFSVDLNPFQNKEAFFITS
jgi:hypothetical protein